MMRLMLLGRRDTIIRGKTKEGFFGEICKD